MSDDRAYLDHNATSPLRPEARAAMLAAMDVGGNASAVSAEGRAARRLIEEARARVAALVSAAPKGVVFTSSATEAAAHILVPSYRGTRRLIVSAVEHSAVLGGGRFEQEEISVCPVDGNGIVRLDTLSDMLASDPRPALVALMLANNETGVVQPVRAAADLVHAAGGALVCDAVQALGKMPVDLAALGADALLLSGHKIGGPQGIGALVLVRDDALPPLLRGGGQEARRRAGTENLVGIAGFGAAADAVLAHSREEISRVTALRDWMEQGLRTISPMAVVLGGEVDRLCNTTCVALPGVSGETAVIAFDLAGVSVATGSACASGKIARSHVTSAMGVPADLARSILRISLGWSTTQRDVERLLAVWTAHAQRVLAGREQAA